jgi:hypothetical protein
MVGNQVEMNASAFFDNDVGDDDGGESDFRPPIGFRVSRSDVPVYKKN